MSTSEKYFHLSLKDSMALTLKTWWNQEMKPCTTPVQFMRWQGKGKGRERRQKLSVNTATLNFLRSPSKSWNNFEKYDNKKMILIYANLNLVPRTFSLAWGRGAPPPSKGKGSGNEVAQILLTSDIKSNIYLFVKFNNALHDDEKYYTHVCGPA